MYSQVKNIYPFSLSSDCYSMPKEVNKLFHAISKLLYKNKSLKDAEHLHIRAMKCGTNFLLVIHCPNQNVKSLSSILECRLPMQKLHFHLVDGALYLDLFNQKFTSYAVQEC